jgi:hypothetical protein
MPGADKQRVAMILWVVLAVVVWNVVFDRVIVNAGRAYLIAANAAGRGDGPYERIDVWMRPARVRAFWWATSSAVAILFGGIAAVRRASRIT